jgi:hypothetical protein
MVKIDRQVGGAATCAEFFALREFAEVGGLISYGSNFTDLFRQGGT